MTCVATWKSHLRFQSKWSLLSKHAGEMGYGFPETPVNSGPLPNTVYSIGVDQIMRKEGRNGQIPIFLDEPVRS